MQEVEVSSDKQYYNAVAQYLQEGKNLQLTDDNENNVYDYHIVLDNNVLTDLAAAAKFANAEFQQLISSYPNAVFIIPEIVFEESISNMKNIQHFNSFYLNFYQTISQIAPVFIVSLADNYNWYAKGFDNKNNAFKSYLDLVKILNDNLEIRKKLDTATEIQDVESGLRSVSKDCGERIAFIYTHIMISEKLPNIKFLSKEVNGVYRKWLQVYAENKDLLKQVYVKNLEEYIKAFRVESFHKLLFDFARHKLSGNQQQQFINYIRQGKCVNDIVNYSNKTLALSYEEGVNNAKFIGMVRNPDIVFHY